MDNLRRMVLCKRSRNEKNRIAWKTKGEARDEGGRGGGGSGKERANRQRGSMSIDYPVDRIDRVDPVGET